jgi:hypothetical protein
MAEIETDYLVIGAGASGMAFTDSLIAGADVDVDVDVDVVMVDRRHSPGGHWNDAYPFVRLHQPSATYGVNSRPLGTETIDATGPERRVLRAGHRRGDLRLLPAGARGTIAGLGSGPLFCAVRLRRSRRERTRLHLAAHRRDDDGAGAQEAGRRHLPRDVGAGDAHAGVHRRRGRRADPSRRARPRHRTAFGLHCARRRQDRHGRVQLPARQQRRPRQDPVG